MLSECTKGFLIMTIGVLIGVIFCINTMEVIIAERDYLDENNFINIMISCKNQKAVFIKPEYIYDLDKKEAVEAECFSWNKCDED